MREMMKYKEAVAEFGGATKNCYAISTARTASGHPTLAEHEQYTQMLLPYLNGTVTPPGDTPATPNTPVLPSDTKLEGAASGYGEEVDYAANDWQS